MKIEGIEKIYAKFNSIYGPAYSVKTDKFNATLVLEIVKNPVFSLFFLVWWDFIGRNKRKDILLFVNEQLSKNDYNK